MNTADLIWMNGEFVEWEDAKVHVLTHGLHYGTGVFEGIRAYETEQGPAIFRHLDHLDRLAASSKLYYMDVPFSRDQLREATHELIGRCGLRSLLHPPARLPRLRPDGPQPAGQPGRGLDRGVGVGRLPGRGGQGQRRAGQDLVLAAHLARLADPARQGQRPVPELGAGQGRVGQGRLRRGDPARRQGPRLRGHRRERVRRARRRDGHPAAGGEHPRRHQSQVGDPDRARPRPRGGRARPGPRRAAAGRRGLPHRHRRRGRPRARDRRHRDRPARAR